jgi:hypothetical protein
VLAAGATAAVVVLGGDRTSDVPISEAVALAKTVKGFLTATTVNAAADAAIARIPLLSSRDLFRRSTPNPAAEFSSEPDRNSGTESSGRNSSRVATEREGVYDRSCEPNSSKLTGSAYGSS